MDRAAQHRGTRPPGLPSQHWKQRSQPARARFLRALDADLGPADRLRYRTSTPMARIPGDSAQALAARARTIPQLLWPEWAIRLTRRRAPARPAAQHARRVPAAGNPARSIRQAIASMHAYRSSIVIGAALRTLGADGHESVAAAICCLAGHLDDCGGPVDYRRRRDLIRAETITAGTWRELCLATAAHPGEARRHKETHSATCSAGSNTASAPSSATLPPPPAHAANTPRGETILKALIQPEIRALVV